MIEKSLQASFGGRISWHARGGSRSPNMPDKRLAEADSEYPKIRVTAMHIQRLPNQGERESGLVISGYIVG